MGDFIKKAAKGLIALAAIGVLSVITKGNAASDEDDDELICNLCGEEMDETDNGWKCPNCGNRAFNHPKGRFYEFESQDDYDDYYDDDDDIPEGCRACGNDMYPHCQASCDMFDD